MNVHVILRDTGEYSDYQRDVLSAWMLERDAEEEIERLKGRDTKLNETYNKFVAEANNHRVGGFGHIPDEIYRSLVAKFGGYPHLQEGDYTIQVIQIDTSVDGTS